MTEPHDPTEPATKPPCGPHAELARSEGVRITRCPCGQIHLHMTRTGVSMQLPQGHFDELVQVALRASRAIGEPSHERSQSNVVTAPTAAAARSSDPAKTGGFVTVVVPGAGPKKTTLN